MNPQGWKRRIARSFSKRFVHLLKRIPDARHCYMRRAALITASYIQYLAAFLPNEERLILPDAGIQLIARSVYERQWVTDFVADGADVHAMGLQESCEKFFFLWTFCHDLL